MLPNIRIDGRSGGEGSRSGNVRSVQEARELQEQQKEKARWTLVVREHIAHTLLGTGYFHADDLGPLGVPPEHNAIKGTQVASCVNRRLMVKAGERKCQHKAANGRKAAIYRITELGRQKLTAQLGEQSAQVNAGAPSSKGEDRVTNPSVPSAGVDSGGGSGVTSHASEPTRSFAPLSLLPEPDPKTWAA